MKITVNGYEWNVRFVYPDEKKMNPDSDTKCMGLTEYVEQEVSIRKGMSEEMTRATLIHEMVHVFLFSYGHHIKEADEEEVCDFFGAHGASIMDKVNRIMDERWND